MRFLFVDANYPGFLAGIYRSTPGLQGESYQRQIAAIRGGIFGEAQFQAAALREMGHEAEVVITNAHHAQDAWARENGVATPPRRDAWSVGRRRGAIPWLHRKSPGTNWETVLAQARYYHPDVLYVEIMDSIPADVARQLVALAPYSIAQIAAPIPATAFRAYGLLISSIPSFVATFQSEGADALLVPLAFEPSVLGAIATTERDIDVSFVGSVGPSHPARTAVLECVADVVNLEVWAEDGRNLSDRASVTLHHSAFGRQMYEVLARSRITLNAHAPWAGRDANNLRLFEATGMGSLLVTDAGHNLGDLFTAGSEIVAYDTPNHAADLVRHYLSHTDDAARIAAAGQARTLRDHTWANRMSVVVEALSARTGRSS